MFKKTITYSDLDGKPITEVFEFGLNESELAKMEITTRGGMRKRIEHIIATQDGKAVFEQLEDVLRLAYGVRSEDNKRFIKDPQMFLEFQQTDAYNVLIMELLTDAGKAAEFMNSLVPQDLAAKMAEMQLGDAQNEASMIAQDKQDQIDLDALRAMTDDELRAHLKGKKPRDMTRAELQEGMARGLGKK